MNPIPDYSQPPREVPPYLYYLLGLPSSATRDELANEWTNQVVPLMNAGPRALFERESMQLVAAGIPADRARRLYKQTKRGQQLVAAMDREGKARARAAAATPPFLKSKPGVTAPQTQNTKK